VNNWLRGYLHCHNRDGWICFASQRRDPKRHLDRVLRLADDVRRKLARHQAVSDFWGVRSFARTQKTAVPLIPMGFVKNAPIRKLSLASLLDYVEVFLRSSERSLWVLSSPKNVRSDNGNIMDLFWRKLENACVDVVHANYENTKIIWSSPPYWLMNTVELVPEIRKVPNEFRDPTSNERQTTLIWHSCSGSKSACSIVTGPLHRSDSRSCVRRAQPLECKKKEDLSGPVECKKDLSNLSGLEVPTAISTHIACDASVSSDSLVCLIWRSAEMIEKEPCAKPNEHAPR